MLKKLVGFSVSTIENLLLLKVHLNGALVGKVYESLFEFDKIMNTC